MRCTSKPGQPADDELVDRQALLRQAEERRAAVGLGSDSTLSTLQLAALYDHEAAATLLAQGCACDLHSACALGRAAEIRRLGRADSFADLAEHLTPMGFAILRSTLASVSALLELGDDPNRPLPRIGFFRWEMDALAASHGCWPPLHGAVAHGYADDAPAIVRALIDAGARLDARSPHGNTPLHLAAVYGWQPLLDTLLDAGADLEARTSPIPAALWTACSPANAAPAFGLTPLMVAAREGRTAAVRLLLQRGAALDARDSRARTPLHVAAAPWWDENIELATLLLDAGARRDAEDDEGSAPFDLARAAGHARTAALLEGNANR